MTALLQDVQFALRMFLRRPGFALVAILTLGLGIGANTAIFSVVHAVVFQPLPYKDPAQLVRLYTAFPVLALVALGTGLVTARRATRVDPMVALRHE